MTAGDSTRATQLDRLIAGQTHLRKEIANLKREVAILIERATVAEVRLFHSLLRQIVPLDDHVLAVRHELGWLVIPREEGATLLTLSDGTSLHEAGTVAFLRSTLREGDQVIDVGANLGLLTIPMARQVGETGRVIALEPLARNIDCLRKALLYNNLARRCEVFPVAASDTTGSADLFIGVNGMMSSIVNAAVGTEIVAVPTVRLDNMIDPGTRIDLIKIDAEGAEARICFGMQRIAAENPDLLVIAEFGISHLHAIGITIDDWLASFQMLGLELQGTIGDHDGKCAAVTREAMLSAFSHNLVFARRNNPRLCSEAGSAPVDQQGG